MADNNYPGLSLKDLDKLLKEYENSELYKTDNIISLDSVPEPIRTGKSMGFGSLYGSGGTWSKPDSDEPLVEIKMVGAGGGGGDGSGGSGGRPGGGAGGGGVIADVTQDPSFGQIYEQSYRREVERSIREQIERDVRAEFNIGIEQPKKEVSRKVISNPRKRKMCLD